MSGFLSFVPIIILPHFPTNVWGVDATGKSDLVRAKEGIERYSDFLARVGAPRTLEGAGVHPDDAMFDAMADHVGDDARGSYKKIDRAAAREILVDCQTPVSFE